MSNPHYSKVANTRDASTKKIGHYGRGQIADPKIHANTGAATTKGNAPTGTNRELGGEEIKITKGTVSGTAQGMGAAKKGGKYTWVGPNDSKW
jgi:hypothetical protein|tara:strand:+ start:975 stop:1253 length:279 start_codon:yes stop_codon:yes gene_type:complete